MNDKDRMARIHKAQLRTLFNVPFFAPGVAKLPNRFVDKSEGIETAATSGEEIRWCREWFDSLDDKYLPTVLCHEVAHCMLGHLWRAPLGADWDVWNQATDHAVNNMLKEFSDNAMGKRSADPFPFPEPVSQWCCNPQFKGMAEEQIYAMLANRRSPQPPGKGNKPGKGGGLAGGGGLPKAAPFGQILKPDAPGQGNKPAPTPSQQKQLANDWQNTLAQSAMMAKGRGDLPGGLDRFVEEFLNPKVPWYEVLRHKLREQAADDWDFTKPNRRFADSDFILPTLESERLGPVVFATDTSGSIDHEMLKHFQTEKQSCLDDMRPSRLVDIYCDSRIHKVAEYRVGDTIDRKAPGGGGTDFRPVFEHVSNLSEPVKCLIYLTDLEGSFPEEVPPYPVIWVNWGNSPGKAPFGEVIDV